MPLTPSGSQIDNPGGSGSGGVTSVFTRTGNVVATSGDYTQTQISAGAIANSSTATTQSPYDDSTDVATDAYADNNIKGFGAAWIRDDFIGASPNESALGPSNAIISESGFWAIAAIAAGTIGVIVLVATFANPGLVRLTTGSASGDGVSMGLGGNGFLTPLGALGSNGSWEMNFYINLPSAANIAIRVGATDNLSTDPPANGIWCEYDTANGSSGTDYTLVCTKATVVNYTATTTAPTAGYDHIRIYSTASGTINMTVNGGTPVTSSTDVPTVALGLGMQVLTRTLGTKQLIIDAVSYMAATGRT